MTEKFHAHVGAVAAAMVALAFATPAFALDAAVAEAPAARVVDGEVRGLLVRLASIYARDAQAVRDRLKAGDVIAELRRMCIAGRDVLRQAVIFTGRIQVTPRNIRRARAAHRVWRAVLHEVYADTAALAQAIAPLARTADARERGAVIDALKRLAHAGGGCDLTPLRPIVMRHKDAPPSALVEFMYRAKPGQALRMMAGVYDPGALRRLQRALGNIDANGPAGQPTAAPTASDRARTDRALSTLGELGRDGHWWVRLYAKSVVTTRRRFRREAAAGVMAAGLDGDAHPLVRDSFKTVR